MPETTTIQITVETWQALNARKMPNDSFDNVIQALLQESKSRSGHDTIESHSVELPQNYSEQSVRGAEVVEVPEVVPDRIDNQDAHEAIQAAVEYIQNNNGATKKELIKTIMPDYSCGYDAADAIERIEQGKRYRGSYWRKILRPGLENHPDIEKPAPHASQWTPN